MLHQTLQDNEVVANSRTEGYIVRLDASITVVGKDYLASSSLKYC